MVCDSIPMTLHEPKALTIEPELNQNKTIVKHCSLHLLPLGDRPDALNIAIVITDGESTIDKERTIPEAEAARAAGITVFAIGIGADIKQVGGQTGGGSNRWGVKQVGGQTGGE